MVRNGPLIINILINNTQLSPPRFGEYVFIRIPYSANKKTPNEEHKSFKRKWDKERDEPRQLFDVHLLHTDEFFQAGFVALLHVYWFANWHAKGRTSITRKAEEKNG